MKLKLADDLSLPADEAVTQKYGFIGRSGSGKSYAAMRLAELFLEHGAQVIALDWVGIWWSLRLAADGKAPGFEHVYIFGGEHADVDLRPESGALMADLVVDKHISVVLDVMHFRKAERTRFATAFAEQFFHRKKTARTACHLFIEEAQAYLPQMVRGDEARMVGVFEDIGKVGRNYGIGNSLISQRPQAINKDVLNQVEVLLAFQTNGPQERKAIAGWTSENTDAGAALVQELPKLHVGHAQVWSPQWLRVAKQVHVSTRETYDASTTPTQKAKAIRPKTLAPADLAALGEQITATIEKAKADDPRELRKTIAEKDKRLRELQTALEKGAHNMHTKVQPLKVVEKAVLKDGQLARAEKLTAQIDGVITRYAERVTTAIEAFDTKFDGPLSELRILQEQIVGAIALTRAPQQANPTTKGDGRRVVPSVTTARPASVPAIPLAPRVPPKGGTYTEGITPAKQRILNALAFLHGIGVEQPEKAQVALVADTSPNGGSYNNNLSALRTAGFIDYPRPGAIALTDAGMEIADTTGGPSSSEALHEQLRAKLPPAKWKLVEALIAAYPEAITKQELADRAGTSAAGGSFNNNVSSLRTFGLLDYPRPGLVVATPVLFLEGR